MQKSNNIYILIIFVIIILLLSGCSNSNTYYSLSISIDEDKGEIIKSPDKKYYKKNEKVSIEVIPQNSWEFDYWSGDVKTSDKGAENIVIVMDSDKRIIANFAKTFISTSINIKGCGSYDKIDDNIIKAQAEEGFEFIGWQDENNNFISKNSTLDLDEVDSNEITAFFDLNEAIKIDDKLGEIIEKEYGSGFLGIEVQPKNRSVFENWIGVKEEDIIGFSYNPLKKQHIKIKRVSDGPLTANFNRIDGAFKLINSWGKNWGYNKDGSIHISYAAAINTGLPCFVFAPRDNYNPHLIAEFEINDRSDGSRDNVNISFIKEGYDQSKKFLHEGGNHSFPDNKIVVDLTELLPFENDNLIMKVENRNDISIKVESFLLRYFNDYLINDFSNSKEYKAAITLPYTINANTAEKITIENISTGRLNSSLNSGRDNYLKNISHSPTLEEIESFFDNKVYQQNDQEYYGGFATGLKRMDIDKMKEAVYNGSIRIIDSQDSRLMSTNIDTQLDYSSSQFFPPVGNQENENSCVAWSMAYYIQTFYEARDHEWNLSTMRFDGENNFDGDVTKVMSPDFVYHLINGGGNSTTYPTDALDIINQIGVSSWAKMPYDYEDHSSWPDELAWREAAKYRSNDLNRDGSILYYMKINSVEDIQVVKNLLAEGYLLSVSIDANKYCDEDNNIKSILTVENYRNIIVNHANTLVGYDDNY